jgi:hypothetical protein
MSDGVTGSDGGGGRLNSVGALDMAAVELVLRLEGCALCSVFGALCMCCVSPLEQVGS